MTIAIKKNKQVYLLTRFFFCFLSKTKLFCFFNSHCLCQASSFNGHNETFIFLSIDTNAFVCLSSGLFGTLSRFSYFLVYKPIVSGADKVPFLIMFEF